MPKNKGQSRTAKAHHSRTGEKSNEMSDTTVDVNEEVQETAQGTDTTDWKAASRKWEAQSKENKTALDAALAEAARVTELETQLREATEKAGSEVSAAKTAANTATIENTRLKAAIQFNISLDDAELFLTATDEETLTKQAEALSKRNGRVQPDAAQGNRSGSGPKGPRASFDAWVDELIN